MSENTKVPLQKLIADENVLLRQMDWKLWIIANAICDALLKNGMLEKRPTTTLISS